MQQSVVLNLGSEPLRFTPDGRVSVLDAIRAMCNSGCPQSIWEDIKTKHPKILMHCDEYSFHGKTPDPVVNTEGWEKIWMLLIDYL